MCKKLCESCLLLTEGVNSTSDFPSLVIEVVEVARDEDVDVAHDLEDVEALLQSLGGQPVVHRLQTRKLKVKSKSF